MGVYIKARVLPPTYDPDAQAFFTASGLTGATNLTAINTLVIDLKSYGIWTKLHAIYPFVGGNATTHSYNLKNTTQYQITWSGGLTHTSNGVLGNALNGYGDTSLNPNAVLSNVSIHLSVYTRTASVSPAYSLEMASNIASGPAALRTNNKSGGGIMLFCANNVSVVQVSNTLNGFIVGSKTSNILKKIYRNGVTSITSTSLDNNTLANANLCILGAPLVGGLHSNNEIAFASIGDGLDDTEAANFYTAVNAYQVALSRNV